MPLRERNLFVQYTAWDTSSNSPKGGDVANHSLVWVKDDTPVVPSNAPIEITHNNQHVCYGVLLTSSETACNSGTLTGSSSTPNVVILQRHIVFEQILGTGSYLINHDWGGPDNLAYKAPNGTGIENGTILCFTREDYNANRRSRGYIVAESTTDVNGRWVRDMALTAGLYTLVFFKTGEFSPATVEISVP